MPSPLAVHKKLGKIPRLHCDGPRAHFLFVAQESELSRIVARTVAGLGYQLVDLETSPRARLIRVFVDAPEGITVDDCARVSDQLSRVFAVEGVDYDRLEISSPGLDRPLKTTADFRRFAGEQVKVRLRRPLDGRANFQGTLKGLEDEQIVLEVDGVQFRFALDALQRVRLVPRF